MTEVTDNRLIWIDLEMTGLNPDQDTIIEIATIVTDNDLNVVAEGPVLAIHQSDDVLANMNKWCQEQHTKSGLVDRVKHDSCTMSQAEHQTLAFLKKHVGKGKSPMCGNSICQDRRFLFRFMPELEAYFHYRHLDVSTLKILAQRWKPEVYQNNEKSSQHLALADIKDSIEELKHYREHLLK